MSEHSDGEVSHRQTYADDSPRGEMYLDDRTVLAHVYDGLSLRAMLFDEREVQRYREETSFYVALSEAGEKRMEESIYVE